MLGGGPGAAQPQPVQLQRAGDAQGDVYHRGHGQLPGGYTRYSRYSVDTLDIYIIQLLQEVCDEVPRMVPEVTCDTRMKEIELKEICVDIDLQLPRSGARGVPTISRVSAQGGVQHGGEGAVQVRAPGGGPAEVRPHGQGGVPGQDEAGLH